MSLLRNKQIIICTGLLLTLLLPCAGRAAGDDLQLTPSLQFKQEYNDNIFVSSVIKKADFISTLSPGIELSNRTERLDTGVTARINGIVYAREDGLNSVDQFYRGRLRYLVTPLLSLSGEGGYLRDSRPDRDIVVSGLALTSAKRTRVDGSMTTQYSLSETTSATLTYAYLQDTFDSEQFTDYSSQTANLGIVHNLDKYLPLTQSRMNLGYARYSFTGSDVDSYSATIGFSRLFNELWSVQVDAGGRYTHSKLDTVETVSSPPFTFLVPVTVTDNRFGFVGQAVVSYKGEKSSMDFTGSYDLAAASGRSGATQRTALAVSGSYRLSFELSGYGNAGWYRNKSAQGEYSSEAIDDQTVIAAVGLKYAFSRDMALDGSYRFVRARYSSDDNIALQNTLFLRFVMKFPML
ncbi:MAG: outer membrane beta-barrel protein [Geobacteraceae bacterium]|nr:outer membrane beta-barrel protein [Geobacteraceae bacterium]